MAGTFGLEGYEVHKTYSAEECLNKVIDLDGKVDIVFVDGKSHCAISKTPERFDVEIIELKELDIVNSRKQQL